MEERQYNDVTIDRYILMVMPVLDLIEIPEDVTDGDMNVTDNCVVCMEPMSQRRGRVGFLECGHVCFCAGCAIG